VDRGASDGLREASDGKIVMDIDVQRELAALEPIDENCCEVCGVEMSAFEADLSYDVTFNYHRGPAVLCDRHLDQRRRQQRDFLDGL